MGVRWLAVVRGFRRRLLMHLHDGEQTCHDRGHAGEYEHYPAKA